MDKIEISEEELMEFRRWQKKKDEREDLLTSLRKWDGKETLDFTLPRSGKKVVMTRSSGDTQLRAAKVHPNEKRPEEFMLENIRLTCMDAFPALEDVTALSNEDITILQGAYARLNRTGQYAPTQGELDDFFESH